ncbi:unnamed protein product [Cochlearia groenlandica]
MATEVFNFKDDSSQEDWHDFDVLSRGDEPRILIKKTSMKSESERQISVDPKSLLSRSNESFDMIVSRPRDIDDVAFTSLEPLDNQLVKPPKFMSCSLPNSAATSPRNSTSHNWKNRTTEQVLDLMLVQDAANAFQRSKSCGEGRASTPSLDFDMLLRKSRTGHHNQYNHSHNHSNHHNGFSSSNSKSLSHKSSGNNSFYSKTESNKSNNNNAANSKGVNSFKDGFKCSALCLYIPGFSKGKPVRSSSSRKGDSSFTRTTTMTSTRSMARTVSVRDTTVLSARASLERFECGSWTSSAMIYEDNADLGGHFFDLPSELIKGGPGGNDQDDPVSAAFVFDKEPNNLEKEIKGVLKTSGSKSRRSMESPRHVRFSTSSPVSYPTSPTTHSITPRLLQATEDFSSFLEAQAV